MIVGSAVTASSAKLTLGGSPTDEAVEKESVKLALQNVRSDKASKEALTLVNGLKDRHGAGVSTMIMLANATGGDLVYANKWLDYHGKISEANDLTVPNGTWSVFYHASTSIWASGSSAATVYKIGDVAELFFGWETPYSGTNTYDLQMAPPGEWTGDDPRRSLESMQRGVQGGESQARIKEFRVGTQSFKVEASIDQSSSAHLSLIVSKAT